MHYRTLACVLLSIAFGCRSEHSARDGRNGRNESPTVERVNDSPFGVAQWKYITRDGDGNTLTEGLLTLPYPLKDGARFAGSWQARFVGPTTQRSNIGPQINGGRLSGDFTEGQLRLELNPNMNDNNVTFVGKVDGDRIIGTWDYSTFVGSTNKGTFEALLSRE